MSRRVKIGLVGTGDIGRLHAQSLRKLPDVELVIAQGRNPDKARQLAGEMGAGLAQNYEAMLKDGSVDAVDLCVPNDLHHEYALAAAGAGKPTLCEKPIALSLEDAREMIEAFETSGTPLMVAHVLRFWPEYAMGRKIIADGSLGKVRSFSARRMLSLLLAVGGSDGWRRSAQRSGGAVLDLQVHDLDYILWLFGQPKGVYSRGVRSEYGSFDHVNTILDYGSDLIVSVESSFLLKGNPVVMDYRAIGDEGSLEFSFIESDFAMHDMHLDRPGQKKSNPPSLVRYRWGRKAEVLAQQPADTVSVAFENEMKAFVGLVRGEKDPAVSHPREALEALRVALASQKSCETGRPIEL